MRTCQQSLILAGSIDIVIFVTCNISYLHVVAYVYVSEHLTEPLQTLKYTMRAD